jgi:flagellar protein FlaG
MNTIATTTSAPSIPQQAPALPTSAAGGGSANIVAPIVKNSEVIVPKQVEIAIDTSGMSSASVRQFAQPIEKAVQEAASSIQQFIQSRGVQLNISIDHSTGYNVIQVIDPATGQTVMQLPSEEAVRIAHVMDSLQGVFVNQLA